MFGSDKEQLKTRSQMGTLILKSRCYLSDDFSKVDQHFFENILLCPERLKNASQIQQWVFSLRKIPRMFATTSLYLLREIYLQQVPCSFINILDGIPQDEVNSIDDIPGKLEILDRELEQSDRYINSEIV